METLQIQSVLEEIYKFPEIVQLQIMQKINEHLILLKIKSKKKRKSDQLDVEYSESFLEDLMEQERQLKAGILKTRPWAEYEKELDERIEKIKGEKRKKVKTV